MREVNARIIAPIICLLNTVSTNAAVIYNHHLQQRTTSQLVLPLIYLDILALAHPSVPYLTFTI
jgi:hypothetical protein